MLKHFGIAGVKRQRRSGMRRLKRWARGGERKEGEGRVEGLLNLDMFAIHIYILHFYYLALQETKYTKFCVTSLYALFYARAHVGSKTTRNVQRYVRVT